MLSKYLLVDKSILPEYYEKVVEAKALISSGEVKDVSEAAKIVGISRSTYYKYQKHVFPISSDTGARKAVISFSLSHKAGLLGEVLGELSAQGVNILTINQNPPVNSRAHVVISMDISQVNADSDSLIKSLAQISGVSHVKLIAIE
ncbi:MAG: ACT domain-containing protein [Clostridia bacterium]|nr:ACT domain-containing protein [Clostridia bacterium]